MFKKILIITALLANSIVFAGTTNPLTEVINVTVCFAKTDCTVDKSSNEIAADILKVAKNNESMKYFAQRLSLELSKIKVDKINEQNIGELNDEIKRLLDEKKYQVDKAAIAGAAIAGITTFYLGRGLLKNTAISGGKGLLAITVVFSAAFGATITYLGGTTILSETQIDKGALFIKQ